MNDKRAAVIRLGSKMMPQHIAEDKLHMQMAAMEVAEIKTILFTLLIPGAEGERMALLYHYNLFVKYLEWLKMTESQLTQAVLTMPSQGPGFGPGGFRLN